MTDENEHKTMDAHGHLSVVRFHDYLENVAELWVIDHFEWESDVEVVFDVYVGHHEDMLDTIPRHDGVVRETVPWSDAPEDVRDQIFQQFEALRSSIEDPRNLGGDA